MQNLRQCLLDRVWRTPNNMKSFVAVMIAVLAFSVYAAEESRPETELSAHEILARCRAMAPQNIEVSGKIVLRNRRGIPQAEYDYVLKRDEGLVVSDRGPVELAVYDKEGKRVEFEKSGRLLDTDVNWSDLTLEYLWWDDVEKEEEEESVHGQKCIVLRLKKNFRTVKIWVDRKTGALMQAEELSDGKTVRRLWGTRIKKFDDKWAPNVLEVETIGSGHRTKITVETIK